MEYSLRNKIFNKIREDIIEGRYNDGEPLVETKLAEEFGVSRTPIREVIRQLELDGLVESVPNRGVFVVGITSEDIRDIYEIRILVEGLAAKWAADKINDEELKSLINACELMEFYTTKGDIEQIARFNTEFHEIIFEAARSKFLKKILTNIQSYIQWARLSSLKTEGRAKLALGEHKAIVEAFKNRDPDAAERLIIEHVSNSSDNIINNMNNK